MAGDQEIVIRDDAGTEHVFPAGFDPKRAAAIVKQQASPQPSMAGNLPRGLQPAGSFESSDTPASPDAPSAGFIDSIKNWLTAPTSKAKLAEAMHGAAHPQELADFLPLLIPGSVGMAAAKAVPAVRGPAGEAVSALGRGVEAVGESQAARRAGTYGAVGAAMHGNIPTAMTLGAAPPTLRATGRGMQTVGRAMSGEPETLAARRALASSERVPANVLPPEQAAAMLRGMNQEPAAAAVAGDVGSMAEYQQGDYAGPERRVIEQKRPAVAERRLTTAEQRQRDFSHPDPDVVKAAEAMKAKADAAKVTVPAEASDPTLTAFEKAMRAKGETPAPAGRIANEAAIAARRVPLDQAANLVQAVAKTAKLKLTAREFADSVKLAAQGVDPADVLEKIVAKRSSATAASRFAAKFGTPDDAAMQAQIASRQYKR